METLMTVSDVAGITKLAVATVRKYVLRKTIPFVKIGTAVRFRPSEIEGWINRKNAEWQMRNAEAKERELFPPEELEAVKNGG
jgi:excisionase family DNA binding protein